MLAPCRELAGQLREEVVQQVKDKGVKLYLVSIGPPERGTEFAKHTGFPAEQLLADPESAIYEALSLHNSVLDTFFNPKVGPCSPPLVFDLMGFHWCLLVFALPNAWLCGG